MKAKPPFRSDVPWVKRQEIPDAQVLDAADQYADAYRRLAADPSGVLLPLINLGAVAVELYLKSLSAEQKEVADDLVPSISRVYASPAVSGSEGHRLTRQFEAIPDDVQNVLVEAYEAHPKQVLGADLSSVLTGLEGALMASRYPFECGKDVTRYDLDHLGHLTEFLANFVRNLAPTVRIAWKTRGPTTR